MHSVDATASVVDPVSTQSWNVSDVPIVTPAVYRPGTHAVSATVTRSGLVSFPVAEPSAAVMLASGDSPAAPTPASAPPSGDSSAAPGGGPAG